MTTPVTGNVLSINNNKIVANLKDEINVRAASDASLAAMIEAIGGSDALFPGAVVQPTAIKTTALNLASTMTALTLPAFGPAKAFPGSQITVDPHFTYQDFYGVGAALTDSAAYVLMNYMSAAQRLAFLTQTFGPGGFNFVRVPMGASDFTFRNYWTYDDNNGIADPSLTSFSIANDEEYTIPLLQEILQINPGLRILCTPWTPPIWLKTTASFTTGNFNTSVANLTTYAQYFVNHYKAYQANGINIWAYTPQNEPNYGSTGYPCCGWAGSDLANFVGNYLGPAFDNNDVDATILVGDVAWAFIGSYAGPSLSSATAFPYVGGVAAHGYTGTPLSQKQTVRPYSGMRSYMTEWQCATNVSNQTNVTDMAGVLAVSTSRYGSSGMMLWNLVLDQNQYPWYQNITNANPDYSRGMVNVNNVTGVASPNVEYYVLMHLTKYLKPGAKRCRSNCFVAGFDPGATDVINVAFVNPDGSIWVYLYNPNTINRTVVITDANTMQSTVITLAPQDVVTVTWGPGNAVEATVFTPPTAPQNLVATAGLGSVALTWTAPTSNGSSDLGGYAIMRGTTSNENLAAPLAVVSNQALSYVDTTGNPGTTYYYTVQAFGIGGYSPASNEANCVPENLTAPSPPVITVVPGISSNIITIAIASNGGSAVNSIALNRSTVSGAETFLVHPPLGTNPNQVVYADDSLTNGTEYFYTTTATNAINTSAVSAEAHGTPSATPAHSLVATGTAGGITAPINAAQINKTSALDLRVFLNLSTYSYNASLILIGNFPVSGSSSGGATQYSYSMMLWQGGGLGCQMYDGNGNSYYFGTGTAQSGQPAATIQSVAPAGTPVWLRVYVNTTNAVQVDSAGLSHAALTAQAYYSADGVNWTAWGPTTPYYGGVGFRASAVTTPFTAFAGGFTGNLYQAMALDQNGAALANPNPSVQNTGTTSFVDTAGNTWTVVSPSSIT